MAFAPDGQRLASGDDAGAILLWQPDRADAAPDLRQASSVAALAWSPDGRALIVVSGDRSLRAWDLRTERPLEPVRGDWAELHELAVHPRGALTALGSSDRTARVTELATGRERRALAGHAGAVVAHAWSPDGRVLATGARDDRKVLLWDAATSQVSAELPGQGGGISGLAWSPDGSRLAAGDAGGDLRVWDVAARVAARLGAGPPCASVAWSGDGALVAAAAQDGRVSFWDGRTLRPLGTWPGPAVDRVSIAFSPNARRLAVGARDLVHVATLAPEPPAS